MQLNAKGKVPKRLLANTTLFMLLALTSLILWVYVEITIYPIQVGSNNILGLTSVLPLSYWIGLALIAVAGIGTVLSDRELKGRWVFGVSIILSLYLFATPILGEAAVHNPWSYYPSPETTVILNQGRVNTSSQLPLIAYDYLPGFHLLSGAFLLVTGTSLEAVLKYAPFFIIQFFLVSIFFIGEQLGLKSSQSLLLMLAFLASFWVPWYYYCPFAFSLCLFILAFGLLVHPELSTRRFVLVCLLSIAIVLMHSLASIAFFLGLVTLFLFRRQEKLGYLILLVGICLFSWYAFAAPTALQEGVKKLVSDLLSFDILSYYKPTSKFVGQGVQQQTVNYFRLPFLIMIAVVFVLSLLFFILKRNRNHPLRECATRIAAFMIGPLLIVFLHYGVEVFERAYSLLLIPALVFIMLQVKNRKIIISLFLVLLFLHIPAHYGSESFDRVFTTDLSGSSFIAHNISSRTPVLYSYWQYVCFYGPDAWAGDAQFKQFNIWKAPDYGIVSASEYIVTSGQSVNLYLYYFGTNPLNRIEEPTGNNVIFNNGQFRIVKNQTFAGLR